MENKPAIFFGWLATAMSFCMYASYIDQIIRNLQGQKGSVLLAAAVSLNALIWALYGILKRKKDWPLIVCNIPGMLLGIVMVVTSFS